MTGASQELICGDSSSLQQLLEPLVRQQRDTADRLTTLTTHIHVLEQQIRASLTGPGWSNLSERDILVIVIAVLFQMFLVWLLK